MIGGPMAVTLCRNGRIEYDIADNVLAFTTMRESELPCHVICGHQVHTDRVAYVDRPDLTREDLDGYDALVTDLNDCAIGVRPADCIPVLLYDPEHKAVAAIHSGWKGTVLKISATTVADMTLRFGTAPAVLKAVIGPGIQRCNFQVGEEVVERFHDAGFPMDDICVWEGERKEGAMRGGWHIDLIAANRWILLQSGIMPENIQASDICTYDDCRFYSARREGAACGRNINSIMLKG